MKASYHVKIEIPGLPKPANRLLTAHWAVRKKDKDAWYKAVSAAIPRINRPKTPLESVKIKFGRHSTTAPDYDGLVMSFKYVCDALIKFGIIKDDSMKYIGMPEFYWEKAPRGKGFITVEVTESL